MGSTVTDLTSYQGEGESCKEDPEAGPLKLLPVCFWLPAKLHPKSKMGSTPPQLSRGKQVVLRHDVKGKYAILPGWQAAVLNENLLGQKPTEALGSDTLKRGPKIMLRTPVLNHVDPINQAQFVNRGGSSGLVAGVH